MGCLRYSDRANARNRNRTPSSDSEEEPHFQHRSFPCYRPNTRYMPTLPPTSTALKARCPCRSWLGENRDFAHLRRQSPREPYQYRNPEHEPESEREHDDDALGSSRASFSSPDRQGPLLIDDGKYVASESKSNRRRHGELGRRGYRRGELQTLLPLPISMVLENAGEDDFADADLSMDMRDDDNHDNEGYGEYELDDNSPGGSPMLSDHTQDDRTDCHSRRRPIKHPEENIFREREIANRDSAATRTLIELGGSAPARRRRLRRGCRPHKTDIAQDIDDENEGNGVDEMETDSLSSRLAQSSSSNHIGTCSNRQHNDYRFATRPRYRRRIELDGYTVAEDELAQSVIYEDIRQNQLNGLNRTPFGRGKGGGQDQASMGVNGRHTPLFPDSNEEVWSDLPPTDTPTEFEIHGAVEDADDSDALSEARSGFRQFPDRAQLTAMASNQDGGQSGFLHPGRGQFLKRQYASEYKHELETKDEDDNENDGQEKKEKQKDEGKPEEMEKNDEDEDEETEYTDYDEEKRNSRSVQSDNDTDIDDTFGTNPAPPFTPPFEYLTAKSGNKNDSEKSTEELRPGREISGSPSPLIVPPQTPGSEPKCNFSYPRPCTAMKPGEHPYPRKVISHIFGRNKKVTQQIPPWIWVYYCRRHYQRARYRAGSNGRQWARIQCERVLDLLEAMRKWEIVDGFTVHFRSREVERLAAAAPASSAPAFSIRSRKRRRRGRRGKGARGCGRVGARDWTPLDEDSDEDGQPKPKTRQERPSVPSPVPDWLASWVQRHEGKVLTVEQAEALIQRILAHLNVVQAEEVRFPDIEILPVYRERWPPTTTHASADSGCSVRGRARSAPVASGSGSGDKARQGAVPARDANNNPARPTKRRRMSAGDAVSRRRH